MGFVKVNLKTINGFDIHYDEDDLKESKDELLTFLDGEDYMDSLSFAKKMMLKNEIQSNNNIEGINDDLQNIEATIKNRHANVLSKADKRIINLYTGYKYILQNNPINKETLRHLYSLLSKDLLDAHDQAFMGDYYRTKPVYILNKGRLDDSYFMGVDESKIEYYMNMFLEYANTCEQKGIDDFIKSQIMHFYFVYVHPYFDVNGRTSRTVAMWNLLNNQNYSYIIFNRAIAFSGALYEKNIIKSRYSGNVTPFLEYMLSQVKIELEKQYLIHYIELSLNTSMSSVEKLALEYIFSINGTITVKDFAVIYNRFNDKKSVTDILNEIINPMIEKQILIRLENTKSYINSNTFNFNFAINPELFSFDLSKVSKLNLKRYI